MDAAGAANAVDVGGPVRVLFIAGAGRSGTTLVGNLLGQVEGFWSGGELRQIWRRGVVENWRCGCGSPFRSCPVWREVLARAFGPAGVAPEPLLRAERSLTRIRHVPLLALGGGRRPVLDGLAGGYRRCLGRLYRAVRSVTGAEVIVDSSKAATYGFLLGTVPGSDLRVAHLVRDPRGTAHSWSRRRARDDAGGPRAMDVFGPAKSSLLWAAWNAAAEVLLARRAHPYVRLRYEDLAEDPGRALVPVLELAGRGRADLPFLQGRRAELGVSHTVSGNPCRMLRGAVEVVPDLDWRSRMGRWDRALVTALTGPGLRRYGYPLRVRGPGRPAQ